MRQGMQQSSGGNEEDPPEEAAEVTLFRHERRVDGGYQGVARPAGPEDGADTTARAHGPGGTPRCPRRASWRGDLPM